LSDVKTRTAATVALWSAPDIDGNPVPQRKMPTVGGLADLQAEAHKEAFEQGLQEGREAGRAEIRALVDRLAGMFHDLAKPFEVLDAEVERELLTLAMALARQIVRRELKADPTQIIGIIREAIAALPVAAWPGEVLTARSRRYPNPGTVRMAPAPRTRLKLAI